MLPDDPNHTMAQLRGRLERPAKLRRSEGQDGAGPEGAGGEVVVGPESALFLEVPRESSAEGGLAIVDALLQKDGRRVPEGSPQRGRLRAALEGAEGGGSTALQLQLLAEAAARWRSWDAVPAAPLPTSVPGLIERLFERVEREHGARLARVYLGLLAARRYGVSLTALADAVAGCDPVLGAVGVRGAVFEFSAPPVRRAPDLVLTRLRAALGPAVAERGGPGARYLYFYHRQARVLLGF